MYHLEVQVIEHGPHRDAGIVDEYVDAAEALHGLLHERAAFLLSGHIAFHAQDPVLRSDASSQGLKPVQRARGHDDLRPLAAEKAGGSQSDSGTGSRHYYDLVREETHSIVIPAMSSPSYIPASSLALISLKALSVYSTSSMVCAAVETMRKMTMPFGITG